MAKVTVEHLRKLFTKEIYEHVSVKILAPILNEIADRFDRDDERIKKLEKEQAKFVSGEWHKGVWDDRPYEKGDAVTHQGSTWIARSDTSAKPGTDPAWQLVVKRGREGRDRGV